MKKLTSSRTLYLATAFFALATAHLFASTPDRYEKYEVYEYNRNGKIAKGNAAEISGGEEVCSVEEIELPLRRLDYGVFRDDFDRLVAKEIRKDAKRLYEEQESAKEVSTVEEIELPIYKTGGVPSYSRNDYYGYGYFDLRYYETSDEPQKVVFYDGLGRRISDSIVKDAKKLYEKQQRADKWASWRNVNVRNFWDSFWRLVTMVMCLVILIFAGTFVWRKVKDSPSTGKKS